MTSRPRKGPTVSELTLLLETRRERAWTDLVARYGRTFDFRGVRLTADAPLVRTVLHTAEHTRRRARWYTLAAAVVPGLNGVLFQDGDRWRQGARALVPSFNRARVNPFSNFVQPLISRRVAEWAEGEGRVQDLRHAVTNLGMELVMHVGFGLDPDDRRSAELAHALTAWREATEQPQARLDHALLSPGRLVRFALNRPKIARRWRQVARVIEDIVSSGRSLDPQGWLARLAASGMETSRIAAEATDLLWAYDALHFVLCAALLELARHPQWWARIRAEIDAASESGGPLSAAQLADLRTLDAALCEVLRRYPASMGIGRRLGAPLSTPIGMLPGGREVLVMLFALHHDPEYWERPFEFWPDRWCAPEHEPVPYSYVPFLRGPRKCTGRNLGEMLMQATIGTIVRSFDVDVDVSPGEPLLTTFMVPRFATPIPARLRHRAPSGSCSVGSPSSVRS